MFDREIELEEGQPPPDGYVTVVGHTVPAGASGRKFTKQRQDEFVRTVARYGNETTAAVLCGVSMWMIKNTRKINGEFDEACVMAVQIFTDTVLEQELFRRALQGVDEDIFFGGKKVGTKTTYSDTLLLAALKKHDPAYRTDGNATQVNVNTGVLVVPSGEGSMEEWIEDNGADVD